MRRVRRKMTTTTMSSRFVDCSRFKVDGQSAVRYSRLFKHELSKLLHNILLGSIYCLAKL